MKMLFKICIFCLMFMSFATLAAKKKAGEIVEPVHIAAQTTLIKPECGYKRPLRVASGMLGNPPFAWEEYANYMHTGYKSYGLGMHIIDDLSKKLGFTYITTGYPTYEAAIKALRLGEVDVLFGVYYSTKLGPGIQQITPGYFKNVFMTYVKKGSEAETYLKDAKNFNDLIGWKGVIREEEEIYPYIKDRIKNLKITEETSAPTVLKMLLDGKADYLITSPYAIEAELRRQKLQNDIIPVGEVLDQSNFFFTFSTNTNCGKLAADFSKTLKENGLSAAQKDTIIRQLIDDWGNRFREEEGLKEKQEKENEETAESEEKAEEPTS